MPSGVTPAKLAVTGDVNIIPLNNATATISSGSGAGTSGFVDLTGQARSFNVGDGTSAVDLDIAVPVIGGGITRMAQGRCDYSATIRSMP